MRPHDPAVRSKSSALARARMHFTAGLGWIRGYPVSVRGGRIQWMSVPAPGTGRPAERVTVDRERLRQATLTHRKLVTRHRGSLARIVGDTAAWSAGVEARLEALKAVIHQGERWPGAAELLADAPRGVQRAAKQTAHAWPALAPLLEAVVWIHGTDGRAAGKAVRFVAERAEGLAALAARERGFAAAVQLVDLVVADGESRAAAPARVLCDPRAFTVPCLPWYRASDAVQALFRKKQRRPPLVWPARPEPELGRALLEALPRLTLMAEGPRRRALRLLGLVTPRGALNAWDRWWASAGRARAAVERRLNPALPEAGRVHELRRHHRTLRRLERQPPPAVPMALLCEQVLALHGEGADEKFLRELARSLRGLPEAQGRHGLRTGFFLHWVALHRDRPKAAPALRRAITLTRQLVREGRFPERILFLWAHIADPRLASPWEVSRTPEGLAQYGHLPPAKIPVLYTFLGAAAWGGRLGPPLPIHDHARWTAALLLLEHCDGAAEAMLFLRALTEAKLEREASELPVTLATLIRCAAGDPDRFVALVRLADVADPDDLVQLPKLVAHTGQAELIGDWLLAGAAKRVLALATRLSLVQALGAGKRVRLAGVSAGGGGRAKAKRTAAWMKRYPDRLRPVLRDLAVVSGEAEQQAGRVLGSAYPDPAQLRREIDGLEARVALAVPPQAAMMRKRLAALRRRLDSPAAVSPARLRKFEEKLAARVRDLTLSAWKAELDRVAVPAIAAKVGAELPAPWSSDSARIRLLAQLAALEPAFRTLAFKLVGLRLGPPPWDLRDHPANRRWVQAMERKGLRLEPWIEGPDPVEVEGPGGDPVTLRLSNDPLEVFRMGEPFGTCLSPGDFNFFSAVANAADCNKRVLFAFDAAGKIVGRCLLAISTDGGLLTFHAYAHDGTWDFKAEVRRWAQRLARRLRTELAPAGEVAKLVASDWYDDGPVDLTGRFRWTRANSPFAKALPTMEPEALAGWIERITAGRGLDTLTAPMLLGMPALRSRPELVSALLPQLAAVPNLPPDQLLDAVYMVVELAAYHAQQPGEGPPQLHWMRPFVRRLIGHPFWRRAYSHWNEERLLHACLQTELYAEALQLLRRTRPRGVRSWDAEYADTRIYAAACAHDALHRPAVALRLFNKLAKASYITGGDAVHDYCRRRAAELSAQLSA